MLHFILLSLHFPPWLLIQEARFIPACIQWTEILLKGVIGLNPNSASILQCWWLSQNNSL